MGATHAFVHSLVALVPGLKTLYDEHISEYDELLPHVFFGDLTRHVVALWSSAGTHPSAGPARSELQAILSDLEKGMESPDTDIQELIAVSFLENLDFSDPILNGFESQLGPQLRRELANMRKA